MTNSYHKHVTKLKQLVDTAAPNTLGQRLKSKPLADLLEWVLQTAPESLPTLTAKAYWILLGQPSIVCHWGSTKKFVPKKKEFGFCGTAKTCKCFQEQLTNIGSGRDMSMVTEKRVATWQQRYGVDNVSALNAVQEKRKSTMQQRDYRELKQQQQELKQAQGFEQVTSRLKTVVTEQFSADQYHGCDSSHCYPWKCNSCGQVFRDHVDNGRVPRCLRCFPHHTSKMESELTRWLTLHHCEFESHNRTILQGTELDIVIPQKNLAIECNGVYWHSDKFRDRDYHVKKFLKCQEQNIHLIQIFEDEWVTKTDIILNRLTNILNLDRRLYARNCTVDPHVSSAEYRQFVEQTHLQGHAAASVVLGLRHQNHLVAVMSFGRSRYTNHDFELIRFCSSNTIVGGASKLFAAFVKAHKPQSVVSYANRCWSQGQLYRRLGFNETTVDSNNVGYWYVKNNQRYHRSSFTKRRLVSQGQDPQLTEFEIMDQLGYLRIWDCGNARFEWSQPQSFTAGLIDQLTTVDMLQNLSPV